MSVSHGKLLDWESVTDPRNVKRTNTISNTILVIFAKSVEGFVPLDKGTA